MERLFTSESVTAGHPDKVCDQISDAILDACLSQDSDSRVACETAINTDFVLVMGKITTKAIIDIPSIVRKTVQEIGYETAEDGFDLQNAEIKVSIKQQSSDISQGVNRSEYIGAGDQGMMFGYATDETEEYMPLAVVLAHRLAKRLEIIRKEGNLSYLRPDGKSQVTVEYGEDGYPVRVDTIVVSAQHDETVTHEQIEKDIIEEVIKKCIPEKYLDTDTKFLINSTGRFVIGGPYSDSGLTGRKIIVDSYGGLARLGGGAFSGKYYTKVHRSPSYAARYVAKNIVGAGLAKQCEIQLAYAIGVAEPVSIRIETFGTSCISDEELAEIVEREFSLSPSSIIEMLKLKQPIYHRTSVYGHFGNDLKLPWEQMDRVEKLKKYRK